MLPTSQNAIAYPRRCDTIATRAQRQMVWTIGAAVILSLGWAALTTLDKVTRGAGRVVPQVRNQMIQHLEGGIVTEILVREGEKVEAGATLIRIDNSFSRAELQQNQVELKAKSLQMLRLEAESRGQNLFVVPPDMAEQIPQIVAQERSLFRARQDGLKAQLNVVDDQHKQKEIELAEMRTRWKSTQREREIVLPRLESLRRLVKMGAVSNNELLENERTLQQVEAKLAALLHDVPRLEAAVSELSRRREETILRFRAEAEKDQRETSVVVAKLEEAITAMRDRSRRTEVVAPVAGIVNKLFIDTIGGVVKSGEPLIQLVPAEASVVVEARVSPQNRADVWPGLPAIVKVSAYDFSLYGGLKGKVLDISPDALSDEKGEPYFRVRLEADATSFGPGKPVIPGMLAQVDILSGRHTVLGYLMKPVQRLKNEALRQ
ncbi:MAG: HlyD family type I secretion periplasmic adaptor subunit [Bosea sp. (in: a-proteobacteria)]